MLLRFSASNSMMPQASAADNDVVMLPCNFSCVSSTDNQHKNTMVLVAAEWFEWPANADSLFIN